MSEELDPLKKYIIEHDLMARIKNEVFDNDFVKDIELYLKIARESFTPDFTYLDLNKKVHNFFAIGLIGALGTSDVWKRPFATCLRYYLYEEALGQKDMALKVLEEVVDRLDKSEKVWNKLNAKQLEKAKELKNQLRYFSTVLSRGYFLVEEMELRISGEKSLDSENETVEKWLQAKNSSFSF